MAFLRSITGGTFSNLLGDSDNNSRIVYDCLKVLDNDNLISESDLVELSKKHRDLANLSDQLRYKRLTKILEEFSEARDSFLSEDSGEGTEEVENLINKVNFDLVVSEGIIEEEMGSRAWERVDKFKASDGQNIDLFLEQLNTAFLIDKVIDDEGKIARLKLSICRDTLMYLKDLAEPPSTYEGACCLLKEKYSGVIEKEVARSSLRSFKINFSSDKFRSSCKEFYDLNKAAGIKDDARIIEELARRIPKSAVLDDVFDYLNRHMDKFHSFLDAVVQCESMIVRRNERDAARNVYDNKSGLDNKKKFKGRCNHCNMLGHKEANCIKRKSADKNSKPVSCYTCQEEGHVSSNCPKKNGKVSSIQKIAKIDADVDENGISAEPMEVMIHVNGKKLRALLDTGSAVTLLPKKYAKNVRLEPTKLMWIGLSSKEPQECEGVATVTMSDGTDNNMDVNCLVVNDNVIGEVLLGLNFIRKSKKMSYTIGERSSCDTLKINRVSVADSLMSNDEAIAIIEKSFKEVKAVFSINGEIGKCDIVAPKQQFINEDDINFKEFRFPKNIVDAAEELLNDLMAKGVIKIDRDAKMLSNVIVVKKKDSSFRPCVDLRMVNKKAVRDYYPIPSLESLLDFASNACYFANLDLVNAFFQVELNDDDKSMFGIWFKGNVYSFDRVPMGYSNAPFILQRIVDEVTSGISCCRWYFDDCIICTEEDSVEKHLQNVEMVLRRLYKHGLKISMKKSNMITKSVKFLGHQLGGKMIQLTDEALNVIDKFPEPKNERQVRRFLGIVGFYRNNIPRLSLVSAPISSKLRKNSFVWDESCREAFIEIKRLVQEQSIVFSEDLSLPLVVFSDASQMGFGAVIGQRSCEGKFKPILHFSKKRSSVIRLKDSTYLEFMAIILCLRKFRNRFLGRCIEWFCDNKPLIMMINKGVSENVQYNAWLCEISMYDIKFQYYPGKKNILADYLSREVAMSLDNNSNECQEYVKVNFVTTDDVRKMQEGIGKDKVSEMSNVNGIYGIQDKFYGKSIFRVYVTDECAEEWIRKIHEQGHFAKAKTLELFNVRFINDKASTICELVCKGCDVCQRVNRNHRRNGREKMLIVDMPREIYGLDLCGPLHQKGERN
uniref:RNA-directed DNA polymerase n=1 Tax=Strongyloides papillosus TaxID=174720 RepID=A0A0N5BU31_STREA